MADNANSFRSEFVVVEVTLNQSKKNHNCMLSNSEHLNVLSSSEFLHSND